MCHPPASGDHFRLAPVTFEPVPACADRLSLARIDTGLTRMPFLNDPLPTARDVVISPGV